MPSVSALRCITMKRFLQSKRDVGLNRTHAIFEEKKKKATSPSWILHKGWVRQCGDQISKDKSLQ